MGNSLIAVGANSGATRAFAAGVPRGCPKNRSHIEVSRNQWGLIYNLIM
jgi:hypothetical protein